jgi:hypothetical protein
VPFSSLLPALPPLMLRPFPKFHNPCCCCACIVRDGRCHGNWQPLKFHGSCAPQKPPSIASSGHTLGPRIAIPPAAKNAGFKWGATAGRRHHTSTHPCIELPQWLEAAVPTITSHRPTERQSMRPRSHGQLREWRLNRPITQNWTHIASNMRRIAGATDGTEGAAGHGRGSGPPGPARRWSRRPGG